MRRILTFLTLMLVVTTSAMSSRASDLSQLATKAISSDKAEAAQAIAQLRAEKLAGVEVLVAAREELRIRLGKSEVNDGLAALQNEIKLYDAAIDEVGGAKYCSVSNLFWYTDLDQAKAAAAKENKPILSLRMLGNLNEEFSCANSRFFRTTLYANQSIATDMRERYILHWQSVRPVPKVTIDFGDGRKLERTLAGNSAHYVLDTTGRPLDCLPGLYSTKAFQTWLVDGERLWRAYSAQAVETRDAYLKEHHRQRLDAVANAFKQDLEKAKIERGDDALPESMDEMEEAVWQQLAVLHAEDTKLDQASLTVIASQAPVLAAGRLARSKARVEDPIARLVRGLRTTISLDTVRNEYVLHRRIHQWFSTADRTNEIFALNERVYAELFLTPSTDPWLGMVMPDTYSALSNNGIVQQQPLAPQK